MPRHLDSIWEYGEPDGGFDIQNLSCKLCGKHMTGGIFRLKYHLGQIWGHDVGICEKTSPEIICIVFKSLDDKELAKINKKAMETQIAGVEWW